MKRTTASSADDKKSEETIFNFNGWNKLQINCFYFLQQEIPKGKQLETPEETFSKIKTSQTALCIYLNHTDICLKHLGKKNETEKQCLILSGNS